MHVVNDSAGFVARGEKPEHVTCVDEDTHKEFSKVTSLEEMVRKMQSDREAMQEERSAKEIALRDKAAEVESLKKNLNEVGKKLQNLENVTDSAQVQDLKSKVDVLKKSRIAMTKQVQDLTAELLKKVKRIAELESELRELRLTQEEVVASKKELALESEAKKKLQEACGALSSDVYRLEGAT